MLLESRWLIVLVVVDLIIDVKSYDIGGIYILMQKGFRIWFEKFDMLLCFGNVLLYMQILSYKY